MPRSGIDTDAMLGYSHTKKNGFSDTNYILHHQQQNRRDCSTIDSRCNYVTTANIPDNKMYVPLLTSSSSFVFPLSSLRYIVVADPRYDAKELHESIAKDWE
jgi:hypothetical protein